MGPVGSDGAGTPRFVAGIDTPRDACLPACAVDADGHDRMGLDIGDALAAADHIPGRGTKPLVAPQLAEQRKHSAPLELAAPSGLRAGLGSSDRPLARNIVAGRSRRGDKSALFAN